MSDKVGAIFLVAPGPAAEAEARGLLGALAARFDFVQIAKADFTVPSEAVVVEPEPQPIHWGS